jgi:hypothetical protein
MGENATFFPVTPHPIKPPPFYTTNPLPSNPNVHGVFLVYEYWPFSIKIVSEGLIGAAITLIRTSPGPGLGIGICLILNVFGASRITAFIIFYYGFI